MMTALISIWIAGTASFLWFGYCNERTYRQRKAHLDRVYEARIALIRSGSSPCDYVVLEDILSYGAHFWKLASLRDPSDILEAHFRRMAA